MTTTTSSISAVFKRVYNDANSDVLKLNQNLYAPQWGKWKKSGLKPSAAGIFNPVVMAGNEQGGAINELEAFGIPDSLVSVQPTITSKLVVWPFQLSGSVIALSETDKQAFARTLDATQQDNLKRMYSDLNRQSWGTGTGQITLANGAGSSTTALVVDNPYPFRKNMRIDVFNTIGGTKQVANALISGVNIETATLTLDGGPFSWSDNAIICKAGKMDGVTGLANAKELTGWQSICDTTTYSTSFEGISVSEYSDWKGNIVSGSGAPVSQDLLQRGYNRSVAIGGVKPNKMISGLGQARNFINNEVQKTRYDDAEIKAGNISLKWGPLEWMVDWTYPIGEVGFMLEEDIQKFEVQDVRLANLDGQNVVRVYGIDAIGGYYVYRGNLGTWKRNSQTRVIDLLEPSF